MDNVMKEQQKVALLVVLCRFPDFILSFIAAGASRSVVVWMEFLESASLLIPGIILVVLARKLDRNLKFKFNYGTERVEAITALCCETFELAGLICIVIFAIKSLRHPEEPGYVLFALILSIAGMFIDFFIFMKQWQLFKINHSKMLHSALVSAKKESLFDIVSVLTLAMGVLFRHAEWIVYFSPIVCLLMAIPFLLVTLHHIREAVYELMDVTIEEDSQLKILKVVNEFYDSYDMLGEIKSRVYGESSYIDIDMAFDPDMKYSEVKKTADMITKRIKEEIKDSTVNIVIY